MENKRKVIAEILSTLGLTELTDELIADGMEIDYYTFSRIIETIRSYKDYSEMRGHVWVQGLFNISYTTNYFSYERLDSSILINGDVVSYNKDKVQKFKVFVSNYDWIDLHITYNEESYATLVFVPKNNR